MSSNLRRCLVTFLAIAPVLAGGSLPLPKIDLPADSPVALLASDYSGSTETTRGSALVVDLHAALTFRNLTSRCIHGLTLLVEAQEVTPGGKASVTLPSLSVTAGESFPIRVDLRLLRPVQAAGAGAVSIRLDGVLFDDLSFFGPNRLNSRRSLLVYEMEARRDRRYFKALLDEGPAKLQQAMLASLARQDGRAGLEVQVLHSGRATNVDPGRELAFAFVDLPGAPVQPRDGVATIAGNEARTPKLEVLNRSSRTVRSVEVGWILRDANGRALSSGSIPSDVFLAPGEQRDILKDVTLRLPGRPGTPAAIAGMTGFVSNVEFADGKVWVPERPALSDPRLGGAVAPSPEEQRLLQIYVKHGLGALETELRKVKAQ